MQLITKINQVLFFVGAIVVFVLAVMHNFTATLMLLFPLHEHEPKPSIIINMYAWGSLGVGATICLLLVLVWITKFQTADSLIDVAYTSLTPSWHDGTGYMGFFCGSIIMILKLAMSTSTGESLTRPTNLLVLCGAATALSWSIKLKRQYQEYCKQEKGESK